MSTFSSRLRRHTLALFLCAPLLFVAQEARAQEDSCHWGHNRTLGSHRFIFPTLVDSAFVVTSAKMSVGAASTQVENLPFDRLGARDFQQAGQTLQGQLLVRLHERVGLFANLNMVLTAATDATAAILQSGSVTLEGGGGVIVNLLRVRGSQLSLRGQVDGGAGKQLSFLGLLDAITTDPIASVADVLADRNFRQLLLTSTSQRNFGGSLAFAQSLGSPFSLQASAGVRSERLVFKPFDASTGGNRRVHQNTVRPIGGIALTADAEDAGIPVAIMAEYQFSVPFRDDLITGERVHDYEHALALGLYYSGRSDLDLGLVASTRLGGQRLIGRALDGSAALSDRPQISGGELLFRYVW